MDLTGGLFSGGVFIPRAFEDAEPFPCCSVCPGIGQTQSSMNSEHSAADTLLWLNGCAGLVLACVTAWLAGNASSQ